MRKILCLAATILFSFNAYAVEIDGATLKLNAEQNQKLAEMKANMKAEIAPIWEEIESGRQRILEIEKRYFEEFWNMLTEEQKQEFAKLNKAE